MSIEISKVDDKFKAVHKTSEFENLIGYYDTHQEAEEAARDFYDNPPLKDLHRIAFLVTTKVDNVFKEERVADLENAARLYAGWVEENDWAALFREEYRTIEEYENKTPHYTRMLNKHGE